MTKLTRRAVCFQTTRTRARNTIRSAETSVSAVTLQHTEHHIMNLIFLYFVMGLREYSNVTRLYFDICE